MESKSIGLNKNHIAFLREFDEVVDQIVDELLERVANIETATFKEFCRMKGVSAPVALPFVYDRLIRKATQRK